MPVTPRESEGPLSWEGYLYGLTERQRMQLIGEQLDLKLDDGRIGRAVLLGNSDFIRGTRMPPFDVTMPNSSSSATEE